MSLILTRAIQDMLLTIYIDKDKRFKWYQSYDPNLGAKPIVLIKTNPTKLYKYLRNKLDNIRHTV